MNWSPQAARTLAWWTKSKIRILSPAPTTGTRKTATAPARSVHLLPAVEPTASAPTAPQPGVKPTRSLPAFSVPTSSIPTASAGHYYLLNNYNPGYYGDGRNAYADITNPNETVFTIPPSTLRNIGDALNEKNISWAYYGDQWSYLPRQS